MTASRLIPSLAAAVLGGGLLCGSCRSAPENGARPASGATQVPDEANFFLPLNGARNFLGIQLQAAEAFALKVKWQAESRVCGFQQTEFTSFSGPEVTLSRAGSLPEIAKATCQKVATYIECIPYENSFYGRAQISISRFRLDYVLADGRKGTLDFSVSLNSFDPIHMISVEILRR